MKLTTIAFYFMYIFIFLTLGALLLKPLNNYFQNKAFDKRFNYGILSMQDLYEFRFDNFLLLCKTYLEDANFSNIKEASIDFLNVDYTCTLNNQKVYVECVLDDLSEIKNEDAEIHSVGRPDVQKLLGQMVHDDVKTGVIITNSCFSEESIEFVKQLDKDYSILLIDGYSLTKRIREIKETNNFTGGAILG